MFDRHASIVLLAAGCSSATPVAGTPGTDVVIDEPLAPSSLPALGVTESVTGAGGERAVRAVTAAVGACVKPVVEREPALTGTMTFRIEPGASTPTKPATGTLAALPAAACVRDALAAVEATTALDYTLTFKGNPSPQPLRSDVGLSEEWVTVDWSIAGPKGPTAFAKASLALRERFQRCALAAEPILNEKVWLTGRVAKGGAVTLGLGKPGDAAECMHRALRTTALPDAGHDYAFSVVLRPNIEGEATSDDAREFGLIGLINTTPGSGGQIEPWTRDDSVPPSGADGLGLAGIGEGGGGRGEGIGLGSIGTLGHGAGTGTGQGFGSGNGRLGGAHRAKPATVKMGAGTVAGRLPREVIQRIVRQNFGRFRLCYENGLRKDPTLAGKVSVSFEITRGGETSKIAATSDMKDKTVVACVQKGFAGLSFPQPEGDVVKVTYPIMFSPGDDAPSAEQSPALKAVPLPPRTIDGKPIAAVSLVDIEKRLVAKGFEVSRVPGAGDAPALFINDESSRRLYTLTLEPEREGARESRCKAGSKERALYIRGDRCEHVLDPLLD
jgi:hypothetical protein